MKEKKIRLYSWQAQDLQGQKQKGKIIATDKINAQQKLINQGWQKIRLQQQFQLQSKVKNVEICQCLHQFAILLDAHIPLKSSLQLLQQNCFQVRLYQWLGNLIDEINAGCSLSQAIRKYPFFLQQGEQQLILVGEMTGKLAQVCQQIAQQRQQSLKLQKKLQKILLYPSLVLGISVLLTLGLLIFIVPQFATMYDNHQAQLPIFTQILLNLSEFIRQYYVLATLMLVVLIVLTKYGLKNSAQLQRVKEYCINQLPVFNQIVSLSRLVNFCHPLQLMLQAGVPLNQALQSFIPAPNKDKKATAKQDNVLMQELKQIQQKVQQGYPFSQSLTSRLFPQQAQQMLKIGEQTGQLGRMLQHISQDYQQQLEHRIDLLSQLLEPVLMLIIGTLIGLIMLGMYLPIFNLGEMVQ